MTFRVGQKVVCVDVSNLQGRGHSALIVEGRVYVIEGFEVDERGNVGINVVGIVAFPFRGSPGALYAWNVNRFRPAVEHKTSIEIFTAMLTPKKTRVRA